jgi:hypothetical protein
MTKAKRIIFSFDAPSERELIDVTKTGRFSSKASAVRESIALFRHIQQLHRQGYTRLYVQNPDTKAEVEINITSLKITQPKQQD